MFGIMRAVVYAKVRRADDDAPDAVRRVMTKESNRLHKSSRTQQEQIHFWMRSRDCEWLRSEAQRRGVTISALIREGLILLGLPTKTPSSHRRSTSMTPSSHLHKN